MAYNWLTSCVHLLEGPAGTLEVLVDASDQPQGLVVMAHPQPLLGGSAQHKVPHFLAKALADAGWCVLRPNFRGVGRSAGLHDQGEGETQDLLWLVATARAQAHDLPLALIGISFGAFVQARVASQLQDQGQAAQGVVLAAMPSGEVEGGRRYDTPQNIDKALVIHGERDERVPPGLGSGLGPPCFAGGVSDSWHRSPLHGKTANFAQPDPEFS